MNRRHAWAGIAIFVLFITGWLGVPIYKRLKADTMVESLCAKDGGTTVYEKVALPASRFDKYGNVRVPNVRHKKADDEFFYTSETTWIEPYGGKGIFIEVFRINHKLYRSSDNKLLAQAVRYVRRGGDPESFSHPSSHVCPKDLRLEKAVFQNSG